MPTFSALLGSNATGTSSSQNPTTPRAQDDRQDAGGFDRLMQSQSRDPARTGTQPASRTHERAPERMQERSPERERPSQGDDARRAEGKRDEGSAKTQQSRADNDSRRTEASGGDSQGHDAVADDSAEAAQATASDSSGETAATTTDAASASPASLPEQLLALLNGLAAAPATPTAATATGTVANTLAGDAPASATAGVARPLLPLASTATPTAMAADTMPAANDAGAGAFAMAMDATVDSDAIAADATLDATTTGETATPTLSVSNATVHPLSRAAAAAVQANQPLSVDSGFEEGFGSRIAWLADQKVGHAEIRVSPDHLGTIDVRLQLDGNRVNAEFHSAQAEVRQALESSLPRLREMLGQQGLQLGQADVGQRQAQQQASNGQAAFAGTAERNDTTSDTGWTPGPAVRATRGLLDEYA